MPEDLDGWIERLEQLLEESPAKRVPKAMSGNAAAKAEIQAWAIEMQAAALYMAGYLEGIKVNQEALVEIANTVIDTVQAILIALGIALLLKKIRKKGKSKDVSEITITKSVATKTAGDRGKPIPSSPDSSRDKEEAFIQLRIDWTTHYLLTVAQGLKLQEDAGESTEWRWKSKKDSSVCYICRAMDGEKSINGDFLPVIIKKFPKYKAFGTWMLVPHAHPRCRCVAVPI